MTKQKAWIRSKSKKLTTWFKGIVYKEIPIVLEADVKAKENLYEIYLYKIGIKNEDGKFNYFPINTPEYEDKVWESIKNLYFQVLYKDDRWHFFYEGVQGNIVRFSKEFLEEVIDCLNNENIMIDIDKSPKVWIDNSPTVMDNKDIFEILFHNFSLIAVRGYEINQIDSILDRITHCFLNHQFFNTKALRKVVNDEWEPYLIATNLINRAKYIGFCTGVREMQKETATKVEGNRCKQIYL